MSEGPSRSRAVSEHLRQARQGDSESVHWLVETFTPILRHQARRRLPLSIRPTYDVDDLVAEVWATVLFKLGDLGERERRATPVFVRYLGSTLANKALNAIRRHQRRREGQSVAAEDALVDEQRGVVTTCSVRERWLAVEGALERLSAGDREILILRGMEATPYSVIASLVQRPEAHLRVAFRRAVQRLRGSLPPALRQELFDD